MKIRLLENILATSELHSFPLIKDFSDEINGYIISCLEVGWSIVFLNVSI